jgi:hypothetical protein
MQAWAGQHILRADALFRAVLGVVLLLSPRENFFVDLLDLPNAEPELFTQVAGGLLMAMAVLLWEAPAQPVLERAIGRASAVANSLTLVLLLIWLLSGELDIGGLGKGLLWAVTVGTGAFAFLETRYFSREP